MPVWWRYNSIQITRITKLILLSQLNGRLSFTQLASFQRPELCLTHKRSHISIWWGNGWARSLPPGSMVNGHCWWLYSISTPFPLLLDRVGMARRENHSVLAAKMQKKQHGKPGVFLHGNSPSEPWCTFHCSPKGSIEVCNRFSLHPCE